MRLDQYLVKNNYFKTRTKAQMAIKARAIYVDNKLVIKPSLEVDDSSVINVIETNVLKYVSRGGLKLEGAIRAFNLDFRDKVVLDIGASTGGFTDCALKHGASFVYAVDVGRNQLDASLKNNQQVLSLENTNILGLPKFNKDIDIIVLDCSFVSVTNLIKALDYYVSKNNYLILLIKPQFEVGHIFLKNGIVKDKKLHLMALNKVEDSLNQVGLYINKIMKSPVTGGDGNQEFLAYVSRNMTKKINFLSII